MVHQNQTNTQNQSEVSGSVQNQNQSKNVESEVVNPQIRADDPLFLHSSDHSSLVLVSDLLNEKNVTVALEARDKFGFLNGEIEAPAESDSNFRQWRKVNSTLISWIMNALSSEISRGFTFANNAKDLWEKIKEQFGKCNGHRVYELRKSIYTAKQGRDSVATYYNKIKRLWDELVVLKPNTARNFDGEECIMQFLMGVGDDFEATRDQVLLMDPLPSVVKAYSMSYVTSCSRLCTMNQPIVNSIDNVKDVKLWHFRLGHCSPTARYQSHASDIFHLIHIDLWEPYKIPSRIGAKYFLTIIEDRNRSTWTFMFPSKTQTVEVMSKFFVPSNNIPLDPPRISHRTRRPST
ncbi:hypothetical protein LIER_04395 [Lithospermum erythrorhizon]|uniref:Retrotransposon gag domain-containing protein n=1 Tax=Lithospermum erythrorhizon TaxID=34254 RepID=A0AAV3NX05_LITER